MNVRQELEIIANYQAGGKTAMAQEMAESLIESFTVQCPECHCPEILKAVDQTHGALHLECAACRHQWTMTHDGSDP